MEHIPLLTDEYLFSHWQDELADFIRDRDAGLRQALIDWNERDRNLRESQLDGQFVGIFFRQLWGYWGTGTPGPSPGYTFFPEYPVPGAGQSGGTGKSDLALGYFSNPDVPPIAQVLSEFKDIRSGLDAPQNRKGNNRSPVQQCLDYLKHAFDNTHINSTLVPTWGVVTDMNEFRLYYRKAGLAQYMRFQIDPTDQDISLIDDTQAAQRRRFLFAKVFRRDLLLAPYGRATLEKLLDRQWTHEKTLEKNFYREYQAYRQHVYEAIVSENPHFHGTRGQLVRMTQRFLDRCIFLLYCDDMGKALDFPTNLLRDILIRESMSPTYASGFDNIWSLVKRLFHTMRDGGPFPPDHRINRFNGGLFEDLHELESLKIPNAVFCAKGQGESPDKLAEFKNTLLYLAGTYNFGSHGALGQKTITLYALGRIFEQSITDLEYMHAEAEGVPTIAKVTKRKRDGVYYTPEWVTSYIAQEVIGARLADERQRLGLVLGAELPAHHLAAYRAFLMRPNPRPTDKPPARNDVASYVRKLDEYLAFVNRITIVDPACGSGAFLIQALQFLQLHYRDLSIERERVTGQKTLFDQDAVIRGILGNNLYGVDINPESVEITQLALWLNTAAPGKPLSTLDQHIRCGNSLVGVEFRDFYNAKHGTLFQNLDTNQQETVNVFDWAANFPEVLGERLPPEQRGFDCVIGNPPYVKLQNFRKVKPDESDFLLEAKAAHGRALYASTQTGNFDLYLPFIEKGLALLNPRGRMGYIAPSLWLKNEYGAALRTKVKSQQCLDRWIDFKSFQVFEEATTYTALQFFAGSPCPRLRFHLAPDGDIAPIDWSESRGVVAPEELPNDESWILLYESQQALFLKLKQSDLHLGDSSVTSHIFQGLITSLDLVYHLGKVGQGKYRQLGSRADGIAHAIEDAIMHPLVSGEEAKRYLEPKITTYVLFPYDLSGDSPRLWTPREMGERFPNAWRYLQKYENELRARESRAFDDDQWYRFGRNQSLDKQESPKLGVAETVPALRLFADKEGRFYFNNVRVNGIIPTVQGDLFFLLGVLNSPVANWFFTKIAKPKDNAYYEANKQFIAPIPIPSATDAEKQQVGQLAERLQTLHTSRRDVVDRLQERIDSPQCLDDPRKPEWLWADVALERVKQEAPHELNARQCTAWARGIVAKRLDEHYERIDARLRPGIQPLASAISDSLVLAHDDAPILVKYGLDEAEARYLAVLWRQILRGLNITVSFTGKRLIDSLLNLRTTTDPALRLTLIALDQKIRELDLQISSSEREINAKVYSLYKLSNDEIALVEGAQ